MTHATRSRDLGLPTAERVSRAFTLFFLLMVDAFQVQSLLDRARPWLSLDQVVMEGKGGQRLLLRDVLADESIQRPDFETEREDVRSFLRLAFKSLSNREQKMLYLYYFEDLRLSEIAELFDVTEARVCQIHALAMVRLRAAMGRYGCRSEESPALR